MTGLFLHVSCPKHERCLNTPAPPGNITASIDSIRREKKIIRLKKDFGFFRNISFSLPADKFSNFNSETLEPKNENTHCYNE